MRDSTSAHLVRSIVSAQPVIICTAEAGLHSIYCTKGWLTSQNMYIYSLSGQFGHDWWIGEAFLPIKPGSKVHNHLVYMTPEQIIVLVRLKLDWIRASAPNPDVEVRKGETNSTQVCSAHIWQLNAAQVANVLDCYWLCSVVRRVNLRVSKATQQSQKLMYTHKHGFL